jgi:hypothetical protein
MRYRFAALPALLLLLAALVPTLSVAAQTDQRCFPETGFCISGPIRQYWERNGGLSVFGFPITEQRVEVIEGRVLQVQWFERDRLEIQPDGVVTTGRLGVEYLAAIGTPWQQGPAVPAGPGCIAFPETGHQVCGGFASAWRAGGGLSRFGLPITGEFQVTVEGRPLTVQYFERRRFELHGAGQVLLGLLGREVQNLQPQQTLAPAPVQPAPPPPPAPAPPPPAPAPNPRGGCHPSYPTVCIPPPPPDLDCGDIPYRRFTVVGSDPHGFDRDNDGIGCER